MYCGSMDILKIGESAAGGDDDPPRKDWIGLDWIGLEEIAETCGESCGQLCRGSGVLLTQCTVNDNANFTNLSPTASTRSNQPTTQLRRRVTPLADRYSATLMTRQLLSAFTTHKDTQQQL